jgi:hypothetical protein
VHARGVVRPSFGGSRMTAMIAPYALAASAT